MSARSGPVNRPFGVTLIAFLTVAAVLWQLVDVATLKAPTSLPAAPAARVQHLARITALWSALGLLAGAGLFGMRRWGWWLGLAYYAGVAVLVGLELPRLSQSADSLTLVVFKVGFALLVIWYLLSRDTRAAFERKK